MIRMEPKAEQERPKGYLVLKDFVGLEIPSLAPVAPVDSTV
jgi:hypothetical protein